MAGLRETMYIQHPQNSYLATPSMGEWNGLISMAIYSEKSKH